MAKRDYYEILGVSRTATEVEMKIAFRKSAMECHPDRNPGDRAAEAQFKELNEAYQALSDPQKRVAYDRLGHAAFEQGGGAGGFGGEGFGASMADIFEDLFGDVMGRRGGRSGGNGRERGSDLRYNMEITLEEAYTGKAATLKLPTSATCEVCAGSASSTVLTNPWRFRVIGPRALAALKLAAGPEAASKLDRAPTLVAVTALRSDDPVTAEEDLCATACATYAVLLAAHARGLVGYWRTPGVLRTAEGRSALGIGDDERFVALIHLGWGRQEREAPERQPPADVVVRLA